MRLLRSKRTLFTSLAMVVFAVLASCKPQRSSDLLQSPVQAGCHNTLTIEEETYLRKQVADASIKLLHGKLSQIQHEKLIDQVIRKYRGDKAGRARVVAAGMHTSVASSHILPVAIKLALDERYEFSASFIERLRLLGVPPEVAQPFMQDVANWLKPAVKALHHANIRYDERTARWDFTTASLNVHSLGKDAKLKSAFMQLFAPEFLGKLLDDQREEVINSQDFSFMPPDEDGDIVVMSSREWESKVKAGIQKLDQEIKTFVSASKDAATYWNMMSGRIVELLGGERGHSGKSAPEIAAEGAYKSMLYWVNHVRKLGVSKDMRLALADMVRTANDIEMKQLSTGLAKLNAARNAAIAAPFIPVVIWAAPYAGAVLSPAIAIKVAGASASMVLTPIAFAAGNAVVQASIEASQVGGSFTCNLYEHFADKGARALIQAPFMAAIPAGSGILASGAAAMSGGYVFADTAFGVINVSMATYSTLSGMKAGIDGMKECYGYLKKAEDAGQNGSLDHVNALAAEAYKACVQAGVDLGQSLVAAGKLSKSAYDVLAKKAAPNAPPSKSYSRDEMAKAIKDYNDLTPEEVQSLIAYGGSDYTAINTALRQGESQPFIDTHIQNIDSAMAKANPIPSDVTVYRGQSSLKHAGEVGSVMTFAGYTSTSIDQNVSRGFARENGVLFEMRAPSGKSLPGIFMPKIDGIPFVTESELLLPRDIKFKVVSSEVREFFWYEGSPSYKMTYQVLEWVP